MICLINLLQNKSYHGRAKCVSASEHLPRPLIYPLFGYVLTTMKRVYLRNPSIERGALHSRLCGKIVPGMEFGETLHIS